MSALLSPPAVLFHVAVTVSPILYAPPVPLAPLIAIFAAVTVGALSVANPANILAGASGNVTVTAAKAGALTDTVSLTLTSKVQTGVTGLTNVGLTGQTVGVTGTAYDYANAVIADTTVAFGNIHVGAAAVTRNLSVSNAKITNATYQDNLTATATAVTGVSVNTLSELAADTSGNLVFTAATGTAGSLAGGVNFVPRGAFERTRPVFNGSAYFMARDAEKSLHKTPGPAAQFKGAKVDFEIYPHPTMNGNKLTVGAVGLIARNGDLLANFYRDLLGLAVLDRGGGVTRLGAGGADVLHTRRHHVEEGLCARDDFRLADIGRIADEFGRAGFLGQDNADLDCYVTKKALDGLFTMVAAEEKQIRENPAARTTGRTFARADSRFSNRCPASSRPTNPTMSTRAPSAATLVP